jgi:hypothetical protein
MAPIFIVISCSHHFHNRLVSSSRRTFDPLILTARNPDKELAMRRRFLRAKVFGWMRPKFSSRPNETFMGEEG